MRNAIFALALAVVAGCQSSYVSRELGARCDRSSECDEQCLAPSTDWPGGFCTIACDTDASCPSGAACINEGNGAICAFTCLNDSHCTFLGPGYACKQRDDHAAGAGQVMVCRGG